ncbi:MAG: CocE/NonD family hydrolase [Acidobacteriota bacterium]|nr:CocE/NonD family hydrolase [Acidobacteriota bacterium]
MNRNGTAKERPMRIVPRLELRGTQLAGWTPKPYPDRPSTGILFQENVEIPMPDGVVLVADIFRPAGGHPAPALISWAPYIKETERMGGAPFIDECGAIGFIVKHNYAFLRVQARGTGRSTGVAPDELFAPAEAQDCHHAIEWAAAQSWCDGNVGMTGMSYFAVAQLRAAATNPPHLKAIFPFKSMTDIYRQGLFKGGAPYTGAMELLAAFEKLKPPPIPALLRHMLSYLLNRKPFLIEMSDAAANQRKFRNFMKLKPPPEIACRNYVARLFDNPFDNDHWRSHSATATLDNIDVPISIGTDYGAVGFHLFGAFELWHRLKTDKRLFIGPPEYTFPWSNYHREMIAWYDWQLKGIDTGYAELPPVRYFLTGAGRWESATDWPIPGSQPTTLYLATLETDPLQPQLLASAPPPASTQSFLAIPSTSYSLKGIEKFEAQVLHYLTQPFPHDTRIVGPVHLHLTLSATAIDTYLMVRLSDVAPGGKRVKLAFGWLRASHRTVDPIRSNPTEIVHDHRAEAAKQLVPGVPTPLSFSLTPISHMFRAGHRLSLEIGARPELLCSEKGEGFDMFLWDPVPYPSRNTIHHGGETGSCLEVHVLPSHQEAPPVSLPRAGVHPLPGAM